MLCALCSAPDCLRARSNPNPHPHADGHCHAGTSHRNADRDCDPHACFHADHHSHTYAGYPSVAAQLVILADCAHSQCAGS